MSVIILVGFPSCGLTISTVLTNALSLNVRPLSNIPIRLPFSLISNDQLLELGPSERYSPSVAHPTAFPSSLFSLPAYSC